jgi:hypothetical protein
MTPSHCAYCGTLAENPGRLAWLITTEADQGPLSGSLPLCVECSHSWCRSTPPGSLTSREEDPP